MTMIAVKQRWSSNSSDDLVALITEPNNNDPNTNNIPHSYDTSANTNNNDNPNSNVLNNNTNINPGTSNNNTIEIPIENPINSNTTSDYNSNPKNFKNNANAINNINNNGNVNISSPSTSSNNISILHNSIPNNSSIPTNNTNAVNKYNDIEVVNNNYQVNVINNNPTYNSLNPNNPPNNSSPIHSINIHDIISIRAINTLANNNAASRDTSCGFRILPCAQLITRFNTMKWFLIFISICLTAQGSAQVYFNKTARLWKEEFGFSESMADWLIVCNALFQGVFSVFVIHASLKYHRMIWISTSLILLALTCFALLIPEFIHPINIDHGRTIKQNLESMQLCHIPSNFTAEVALYQNIKNPCLISFLVMFIFQAILGVSTVSVFIHGAVFIDDHESVENAILLNGLFLAVKEMGPYIGNFLTWLSVLTQGSHIFGAPAWIGIIASMFVFGLILGMYPKFLTENIRIKSAVCSADALYNRQDMKAFLVRILRNKVVFLNIFSFVFFCSALSNFFLIENKFTQAKFGYSDKSVFTEPIDFEIVITVLKPFIIFFSILFTASVIIKYNLRAFHLSLWNGIVPAFLVCVFLVYIFLGCDTPDLNYGENKLEDECNGNCNCERSLYEPVCVVELQRTFYSPCYAGCTDVTYEGGYMTYLNCTCSSALHLAFSAYPGLCTMSYCYPEWLSRDLVQLLVSILSGSVLVSHTVVSLYCVHFSERCYALALQIAALGLFGFGPVRVVYRALTDAACRYLSPTGSCRLHDPILLTRYILTVTIILLLFSSLCGLLMAVNIRRQTAYTPDMIGTVVPRRRRRYQSATFVAQTRMDLTNQRDYAEDAEEQQRTTEISPLVTVEIHHVRNNLTMDTIPEESNELLESEESPGYLESKKPNKSVNMQDVDVIVNITECSEETSILEETTL